MEGLIAGLDLSDINYFFLFYFLNYGSVLFNITLFVSDISPAYLDIQYASIEYPIRIVLDIQYTFYHMHWKSNPIHMYRKYDTLLNLLTGYGGFNCGSKFKESFLANYSIILIGIDFVDSIRCIFYPFNEKFQKYSC